MKIVSFFNNILAALRGPWHKKVVSVLCCLVVFFTSARGDGSQVDVSSEIRSLLQQASDAATSVSDKSPFKKLTILAKIAVAQVKVGDEKNSETTISAAKKVGASIPAAPLSLGHQLETSLIIAGAQHRSGNRRAALATVHEILETTEKLRSDVEKNHPLSEIYRMFIQSTELRIAVALAYMGEIARALELVKEATGNSWKHQPPASLAQIAAIQWQARDENGAQVTFKRAEQIANSIKDETERIRALLPIAEARAQAGDQAGARAIIESVRKMTSGLNDKGRNSLSSGLSQIAKSELRMKDVKAALRTSATIPHEIIRFENFLYIAVEQFKTGDQEGAQSTLEEATKQALALKYVDLRKEWLISIAMAYAKMGNYQELLLMVRKHKLLLLPGLREQIAIAQARNGNIDEAIETINKLEERAKRFKITALAEIGAAQWKTGRRVEAALTFEEAIQTANVVMKQSGSPSDLEVLGQTISIQVKAGDSEGALTLARKQGSPMTRAYLLLGIAEGLSVRKESETSR